MAIKELQNVAVYNAKIQANGNGINTGYRLDPGMVLTLDPTTGLIDAAARGSVSNPGNVLGLLTDYTQATGDTDIYTDPVGSSTVDPTTGNLIDNSNAQFPAQRRQAFSYNFAEQINNVTNFTAGASGFQGPARGVGYFVAPSQVVVDANVVIAYQTNDVTTVGSLSTADTALVTAYAPGDLLTFGTGANSGRLVKAIGATNGGYPVARVDSVGGNGNLFYITVLS